MARTKQTARKTTPSRKDVTVAATKGAQKMPRVVGVVGGSKQQATAAAPGGPKTAAKRRITPGVRALQEIEALQKSTELLVAKSAIVKTARQIAAEFGADGAMRFTPDALCAIHVALEAFAIDMFDLTNELAIHGKRVTVMPRDMRLMRLIITRYTLMNLGVHKAADVTTMDEYRAARRHANQAMLAARAERKAAKAEAALEAGVEAADANEEEEEEEEEEEVVVAEPAASTLGKRTRGAKKDDDENDADATEGGDDEEKENEPAKKPAAKRGRKTKEETAVVEEKKDEPAKVAEAEVDLF